LALAARRRLATARTRASRRGSSGSWTLWNRPRRATWEVVAWNAAATALLFDYGSAPPEERNALRFIFLDPRARAAHYDWDSVARFVVSAFRIDAARAGAASEIEPLVEDLCLRSPEFKAMWRDNEVLTHGSTVRSAPARD
jgi:hypothetical protein